MLTAKIPFLYLNESLQKSSNEFLMLKAIGRFRLSVEIRYYYTAISTNPFITYVPCKTDNAHYF